MAYSTEAGGRRRHTRAGAPVGCASATPIAPTAEWPITRDDALFEALVASVTDYAIIMLEPSGHVMSWNSGAERLMGYRVEEILGRHFSCFYTAQDRAAGRPDRELRETIAHERHEEECLHVRKDGSTYVANVVLSAIRTGSGRLRGFAKVTCDVTERRQAQAQLARQYDLVRRRIAEQIHDGPIQTLLSASQDLRDLHGAMPTAGVALLERASTLIELSIAELRETTIEVRPVAQDGLNLEQAVRLLADQAAARGKFNCSVDIDDAAAGVDDDTALTVIRELLSNVGKHAHAEYVSIEIRALHASAVRLAVSDDGVGMAPARVQEALGEGHIGLALLSARVQERGGSVHVVSHPNDGTTVIVTISAAPGGV